MFEALRSPLTIGASLLLRTICYAECPPLLASHLLANGVGAMSLGTLLHKRVTAHAEEHESLAHANVGQTRTR